MTLQEFLRYMQSSGINVIIGFAMTFAVEWIPQWETASSKVKRLAMFLLCETVPVVGATIAVALAYQPWSFAETYWPALVAGFAAFSASTIMHTRKL